RADQGGQCRARTGDVWPLAARGWPARRAQALRRLVARLARQLDGLANDRARGAARRFFVVTVASALALVVALLLVAIAAWTVVTRRTFAAVEGFVAYGLLLSIAWVALNAIDVALTEAAIGAGLTGVLLIGAAARLRTTEAALSTERPGAPLRRLAAPASATVAGPIAIAVLPLPY